MIRLTATAAFGLEAAVKREVARLGFPVVYTGDGRVDFTGDVSAIPRANLWLRCADRVLLHMGEFTAATFDALFEGTKALPWEDWISEDGRFTVIGKSVKSALFSVPDCQAIVKKAVVERLKTRYKRDWFEETGAEYKIQVALLKDTATLTIDTSGAALHRRGYRATAGAAPIKETLAAAMLEMSFWKPNRPLYDPLCGSGTFLIEAALMARNIAPGLTRPFAAERWEAVGREAWRRARVEAYAAAKQDAAPRLYGSDIDPVMIDTARACAAAAGAADCVSFEARDVREAELTGERGVIMCNPPYGERLGDLQAARPLYKALRALSDSDKTWAVYVITSDEEFEKLYGRRADARRKLFNGAIKTNFYQFHGPKPEHQNDKNIH